MRCAKFSSGSDEPSSSNSPPEAASKIGQLTGCQLTGLRFLGGTFVSLRLGLENERLLGFRLWNEWWATVGARIQSKTHRFFPVGNACNYDSGFARRCGMRACGSSKHYLFLAEIERLLGVVAGH
jgi:hypothetical protein